MTDRIRVLIVDDIAETRDHLAKLLGFESDIEVVGQAAGGAESIEMAERLKPDVVLMDINMPDMDGITATERLSALVPGAGIVMMSVQGEADYLRRSMLAGAREFLVKPFSSDELTTSIRQVYQRESERRVRVVERPSANGRAAEDRPPGRIVTLFSPKGGVGRTTIAVNLAVAAAGMGQKTALVDGSFQFGDVGILLNLNPKNKSIADLIPEMGTQEPESLDAALVNHSSGVQVLLAPPSPEMAELITSAYVRRVLERLRESHDIVIVDSWPWFQETTLNILDISDTVLAVLTLEITNIKDIRLFLDVADQLGYPDDKIQLVLNRSDAALGIRVADVQNSIGRKIHHTIVSDGRTVVYALNRGVPFCLSNPEAQVSRDIVSLAQRITGDAVVAAGATRQSTQRKSVFAWR